MKIGDEEFRDYDEYERVTSGAMKMVKAIEDAAAEIEVSDERLWAALNLLKDRGFWLIPESLSKRKGAADPIEQEAS